MTLHKFKYGDTESGYLIVNVAKFKETSSTVSKMDFLLQSELTIFLLNDDVEFYNQTTTLKFKGKISKVSEINTIFTIEVKDLGNELTNERFSQVYRGLSPEAIIEDIITTQTNLTFSSTVSTGTTITKQVFKDGLLIDSINKLMELFNGAFSISKTGVFSLVKKQGNTNPNSINTNNNDILQGKWVTDANKKFTKIIVDGANIDQQTVDTSNTGSFSIITLNQSPKDLKITNSAGTVLKQTTSNIVGDYEVDIQAKTVSFSPNQTDPVADYTYESQVKVEIGSGATLHLKKSYIETTNEALDLALSALTLFQDGIQTSKWLKSGSLDFEDYTVGDNVSVSDGLNNISDDYQVSEIVYEYPDRLYLSIGEDEDSLFNWQKETQQRIQELEQKDQNSEFITVFDFIRNKVQVQVSAKFAGGEIRTYPTDTFYLDEDGSGVRNQMLDDGTGPVMRELGYTSEPIGINVRVSESEDVRVSEAGDRRVTE
jgi:hypothetical protein